MNKNEDLAILIDKAVAGDRDSLETVILSVRDLIFNLSLRMFGTFHDAEDATQDIILKIITHLSSFKQESSFSTWVFRIATNILDLTPEAYRQRLSRIRRKMADFLSAYCGEYGSGKCRCKDRLNYAIQSRRLNPAELDYTTATEASMEKAMDFKNAMEEIDDLSAYFSFRKLYESPEHIKQFLKEFLKSASLSTVTNA